MLYLACTPGTASTSHAAWDVGGDDCTEWGLAQGIAHRGEFGVRLGQLQGGIRTGENAAAGEEPDLVRVGFAELAVAEGNGPFAIAASVDPGEGPAVPLTIQML